ncbi:hypothetical protein HanRHA438_Chr13g0617421 [Helianthus annuus]|uniref:Uncharacterized protein n=1 Tax=Helianthus annuus TaxID=4232 RepID=A0A9K3HBV1_HELAN|nr:hypothetical protein HanXRQr2_Chr13g0607171 [Helianthus annuus]KAJ0478218.1 hypothetical protein HanHA300_Chr13g0497791 [Helianthus annuus]KAJ0499102.1 hypothetical protein HanHA89_Chr13g0530461 [Helianthus annuus]KAJ0665116.1 hypothetical protein HanLR1_Chr13g0500491 [Helianthus annuus]KAJ0672534.1 hypothetical protein HanOQP8_Chr13g0498431 [Helianthus annuus]
MRSGADVEDVRRLEPWNEEMSTFADGIIDNTAETVEIDVVERGTVDDCGGADAESGACEVCEEGNCCLIGSHCCGLNLQRKI